MSETTEIKSMMLENKIQNPRIQGSGCAWYISRKQRFCSNHVIGHSDYCHAHSSQSNSQPSTESPEIKIEGKKQNLKRRMKRMLNPFIVRTDISPVNYKEIFTNPVNKFHLDIGFQQSDIYIRMCERKVHSVSKVYVRM